MWSGVLSCNNTKEGWLSNCATVFQADLAGAGQFCDGGIGNCRCDPYLCCGTLSSAADHFPVMFLDPLW